MKHITLFLLLLPLGIFAQTKWQVGLFTPIEIPNKSLMPKMNTVGGFGLQFAYQPISHIPVALEFKSNFGSYYSKTMEQTYYFDDYSSTTTDVSYTSGFNQMKLGAKIQIGTDFNRIRGFITPQIGTGVMRTKIRIADPLDEDDCQPLANETQHKYRGYTYGLEVGGEIDLSLLIPKIATENRHYVYISGSLVNGFSKFEYVNARHMQDHNHGPLPEGGAEMTTTDGEGRPITATFINLTTNNLHDHKITEVYNTALQYWGIRIGYVIHF